jgi:hypothetical protein
LAARPQPTHRGLIRHAAVGSRRRSVRAAAIPSTVRCASTAATKFDRRPYRLRALLVSTASRHRGVRMRAQLIALEYLSLGSKDVAVVPHAQSRHSGARRRR